MKKILGLDLGTNSIGWAIVNEAENSDERSSIIKLGVRVNPLTVDEKSDFEKGKSVTTNAVRRMKRSLRRNLQRYKLRRQTLVDILKREGWISDETILAEQGNRSTFQTIRLRAKAADQEISLEELARVFLMINKKRGYKSNRKAGNVEESGQAVNSMDTAIYLEEHGLTPGEYAFSLLSQGHPNLPDFYRSDLEKEFDRVWEKQREFYPELLTESLKEELKDKNEKQTWTICRDPFQIEGIKRTAKGKELLKENYEWRSKAVREQLDLESLAVVLQKINGQIRNSGGYLGDISDRSKELYFNKMTIGQYLEDLLHSSPGESLKNKVFYRQDYIDEFDRIWNTQAAFHPELTAALRKEIRDVAIFYQRPLKSQKGLVNICEFEKKDIEVVVDGKVTTKTIGPKACPKSSPVFQEFKIWQVINNIKVNGVSLEQSDKERLAFELSIRDKMSQKDVLKFLFKNPSSLSMNFKQLEGNRTGAALFRAYAKICELSGNGTQDGILKEPAERAIGIVEDIFKELGFSTDILCFALPKDIRNYGDSPLYKLWHLLYSYESDNSTSGIDSLVEKLRAEYGFDKEYAKVLASVTFDSDYGNLSAKAMKKILPYMKDGLEYSLACEYAGYRHSAKSLTKEEIDAKTYKDKLDIIPKNSLRNPVVEKILNQMVNVVNGVITEYGKPDEIRIELARELKKNQEERRQMTEAISKSSAENEKIRKLLQDEFGIPDPSRNDVIRYKLYSELEPLGYHTLYSGTYIPREALFSGKSFDIEHIIPQAKLFDDSMSNKTLEARRINLEKGDMTAFDFVKQKYGEAGAESFAARVDKLLNEGKISQRKRKNLLTKEENIPSGFIDRDLRDTQYIARKAKEMLEDVVKSVVTTTGSVTDRLREDWQLVDVMRELNWEKYSRLGLTYYIQDRDGRQIPKIKDWTKRNDHRHHAMDALTIAFTKRAYIQYLNNLNARVSRSYESEDLSLFGTDDVEKKQMTANVRQLEKKYIYRDGKGHRRFLPPMPLDKLRVEAKKHLEDVLVSIKAKNKVVTKNVNISKVPGGFNKKVQLTPRGQLHNETVYGSCQRYVTKEEKVGASFTADKIAKVASPIYRAALLRRLEQFGNDPKKAFSGKNSLEKNPLYLDDLHTRKVPEKVKLVAMETVYTIRKEVKPDNFKDSKAIEKVMDKRIRDLLLERLHSCGDNANKAFSNLDENPIWLDKEKGLCVRRVTIKGVNNAQALHEKRDYAGRIVKDKYGLPVPSDFVSPSNNHHIAIFMDADGNLQEHVVPFMDATVAARNGDPVVNKEYNKDLGWKFLFSMKQNEYFVFPNPETGFNPEEVDLFDPANYAIISPNLFRVQKLATKNYVFRHHLETNVDEISELRNTAWVRYQNVNALKGIVKVRVNHLGQIVQVGEY